MIKDILESTYGEELYVFNAPMTIAIPKPWDAVTPDERILLGKILSSIKQSLASVQIVHTNSIDTSTLAAGSKVISFGVKLTPEIPTYQLSTSGNVMAVQADTLEALDDLKKKNLWAAIRQIII